MPNCRLSSKVWSSAQPKGWDMARVQVGSTDSRSRKTPGSGWTFVECILANGLVLLLMLLHGESQDSERLWHQPGAKI